MRFDTFEPKCLEIPFVDERLYRPNRVVFRDVVI